MDVVEEAMECADESEEAMDAVESSLERIYMNAMELEETVFNHGTRILNHSGDDISYIYIIDLIFILYIN